MWLLRILQLLFVMTVVWVLLFEILIPILTRTPLFPLFKQTKKDADNRDRSKKDDKSRKHQRK
jgi:hypothetical protein